MSQLSAPETDEAVPGAVPDLRVWGPLGTVRWRSRYNADLKSSETVLQQLYGERVWTADGRQAMRWFDVPVVAESP